MQKFVREKKLHIEAIKPTRYSATDGAAVQRQSSAQTLQLEWKLAFPKQGQGCPVLGGGGGIGAF